MDVIYRCCAGLDVHKASVAVCLRRMSPDGKISKVVRTYKTVTRELSTLAGWLTNEGVTHVAMESTGVYWKPIFNVFEGRFEVLLCNAHHVKQVPGRKTDVKDCEWLAQLLQHGLLKGSFIPPRPVRELRDLTRHRAKLTDQKTAVANRIHKVLEDANIKLSSVASDVLGASGRSMIQAIIDGEEDAKTLAELAQQQLRGKIPELEPALEGTLNDHHRFQLKQLFEHLRYLETQIATFDERIRSVMANTDRETAPPNEAGPLFASAPAAQEDSPLPFVMRCGS
jgi:transposase